MSADIKFYMGLVEYVSPNAPDEVREEAARILVKDKRTIEWFESVGAVTGQLTVGFAVQKAVKRVARRKLRSA